MKSPVSKLPALTLAVLALLTAGAPAIAGGFRQVTYPAIPAADNGVVVDGSLVGWESVPSIHYDPLPLASYSSYNDQSTTAQLLRAHPHAVDIRACYDPDALYIAVEWTGVRTSGSANLTANVLTDEATHVSLGGPGSDAVTRYRHSEEGEWIAAAPAGVKAAVVRSPNAKEWIQEARLPWKVLTAAGGLPADGRVRLALDFEWSDLTPDVTSKLALPLLHADAFVSFNALASAAKLDSLQQVGGDPDDWADLKFVDGPATNETANHAFKAGASTMEVGRASSPPSLDGSLDAWPAKGFVDAVYAPGFIGRRYGVKIAAQYDSENLYVAAHFRGSHGIHNPEPQAGQQGFLGGDNLQIRLFDGAKKINLCGWRDTLTKQSALTSDGKDLPNPFLLSVGAKEAFRVDEDGDGYVQEIAIPWSALTMTAPSPGATWKATFQPWFDGLNPEFTAYLDTSLAPRGAIPVRFTIPESANVTLSVFDKDRRLLRQLLKDVRRGAGANTVYWDGLDQYGKPVAPGSYVVKGLYHPPIGLAYKLTVCNPGNPPWPTSDGTGDWLADESSPQAVATDGDTVYLAAPGSEVGWRVIAVDARGQRKWGYNVNQTYRSVSLSLQGDYLYVLYSGLERTIPVPIYPQDTPCEGRAALLCLDKHTGQLASFSANNPNLTIATWPYAEESHCWIFDLDRTMTYNAADYGGQPGYYTNDVAESTNALGLAATSDRLYVSMFHDNKILVFDKATAKPIGEISVPAPVGLYPRSDGTLLCVSGVTVVSINPAAKTVRTLIDHDLLAPHEVTTDSAGNIYVSDWGKSFQVKVFSSSGKFIRAIGKEGGRPWVGKWDPNGMLVPRGIGVTNAGKLWVTEDDSYLDRISVWDSSTGAFIRDYLGPTTYTGDGYVWVDPTDPTLFLGMNTFWRIDYDKGTWTPISTALRRMDKAQPFIAHQILGEVGTRTFTHAGRQYVAFPAGGYMVFLATTIYEHVGDQLKPVAAVGLLPKYGNWDGTVVTASDGELRHTFYEGQQPDFFKNHAGDYFSWTDLNGDGFMEENEVKWVKPLAPSEPYAPGRIGSLATVKWGTGTDVDGATYFTTGTKDGNQIFKVAINAWTPAGAPIYDIGQARLIGQPQDPSESIYASSDGKLILAGDYEYAKPKEALQCWDTSGNELWTMAMPKEQQRDDIEANHIGGEYNVPGVGDVLMTSLYHGNQHCYLVTTDGLYVTCLLDDTYLGPTAAFSESEHNAWQAPNGNEYLENPVNDGFHILQVTGLNETRRFQGTLDVSSADVSLAAKLRELPAAVEKSKPIIKLQWLAKPPTIDGDLSDWRMDQGVEADGARGRSVRAALGRDATNLYLAFHVQGAHLVNGGADWQALFTTGDCVDLMLSTVPSGGKPHYQVQPGDERLLLTVFNGKPIAVLYRPVSPGSGNPTTLANTRFDEIIQLPSVAVAYRRADDNYSIEASVPLADLGIDPAYTDILQGDVGAVFADETGHTRSLRLYYYNKDTAMVADLSTEATLQPGNWGEIEMPMGPNLLKNGDFEDPLSPESTQGWSIIKEQLGGQVDIASDVVFTGSHSLEFTQTSPVTYPASAYALPDYAAFAKSVNGGKGQSYARVSQTIPVTAGKHYWLRAHYTTRGMKGGEIRTPGNERGYDALIMEISWSTGNGGRVFICESDTTGWTTAWSKGNGMYTAQAPFLAPSGATSARISIEQRSMAEGYLPVSDVDDVEFAEAREK